MEKYLLKGRRAVKCKFDETKECPNTTLFEQWKEDKAETAWLTLGVCPKCPIYKEGLEE